MRFRPTKPARQSPLRRGPNLRIAALLAGLLLVAGAISHLGRPATHHAIGRALGEPSLVAAEPNDRAPLLQAPVYAAVTDNAPFRGEEQPAWFATLGEVAGREPAELAARSVGPVGYAALTAQPEAYRGRVVTVAGGVLRVESVTPAANDLGIESLWRVTLEPAGGEVWPITVYTLTAPRWDDEPYDASAVGVFYKKLSYRWAGGVGSTPVVIARRLEQTLAPVASAGPTTDTQTDNLEFAPPQGESLGRALLADLGVDTVAFDSVVDRQRLLARESEAFYAVLGAVAQTPAPQLVRLARAGLDDYAARRGASAVGSPRERQELRALRKEQQRGRYSVVPLFGSGQRERGELVVLDTIVRRAVRVDASRSKAAAEQGVDHYYELEAFTEDSQNLPMVFVVRDLPAGFPVGDRVRQPARLAGFFFKQWAYRTRKRDDDPGLDARQFSPLLIGRAPIPLAEPTAPAAGPGPVIGLAAVGALATLILVLWRVNRTDRAYEQQRLRGLRYPEDGSPDFASLEGTGGSTGGDA